MKYIADKSFYKKIILIVIPIVLQQIIQQTVTFIDNFMVAGLGEEAVAGIAIANQYYQFFFPVVSAICAGSAIFIAQYYGGKNFEKLRVTFGISLVVPALISIVYMIAGLVFDDSIIHFFNKDNAEAIFYAKQYLTIIVFTYLPFAISNSFTFLFRPIGKARVPFLISSVALIINAILNYGLIYGRLGLPQLGVQGAALGTLIARFVEMFLFIIVYKGIELPFKESLRKYIRFTKESFKEVFSKVGYLFINELLFTSSLILIFKAYSTRGIVAITALNVAQIIARYILIFTNGTGTASAILVGNNLGADNYEEAEKNANYLMGYVMIAGTIVMFILLILSLFIPNVYTAFSQETKDLLKWMIIVFAISAPIQVFTRVPFFVLRAGGRVREILILDALFMWVVKIPLAFGLAYLTDLHVIWLLVAVESTRILNGFISMYFFNQKKWLNKLG